MNVDFLHNQIVRDTVTNKFIESFNENLVPKLISEYGSSLEHIQFYEDYITAGFRINGEFHYPLTLVVDGRAFTRWVKWQVSNYRVYDNFNPFSYKGAVLLDFELPTSVPEELVRKIAGRPIYSDEHCMPVIVSSASEDKTFLAGKYSQGFVDELAHRITEKIEEVLSISGLAESGVVLELRFAPGTFMEHRVGNTTYRRVLIKARGCSARDLWIKWTRLDGNGIYTVSDNVASDDIEFALAEDVPGKIREKEYRYLTAESVDRYQSSMGRKNITEWREMMRRVIRRGEVMKLEGVAPSAPSAVYEEEEEKIPALVSEPTTAPAAEPTPAPVADEIPERDEIKARLAALLGEIEEESEPEEDEEINSDIADLLKSAIGVLPTEKAEEPEEESESLEELLTPVSEESDDELEVEIVEIEESAVSEESADREEALRREIEERVRRELEEEIKRKHEEAEQLRIKLEAQLKAETREKELMAEAARAAIAEQQRIAREREAEEARLREENELRMKEEAEREERRRLEEAERIAREEKIRAEAEALAKAKLEAERASTPEPVKYVSKCAKLIFRYNVDPSITKRIHEIILATIKYYHKEDVYIRIKASIPDATTVNLDFVKIPENEMQLLVNIIKVLGKSDLGIVKAILD